MFCIFSFRNLNHAFRLLACKVLTVNFFPPLISFLDVDGQGTKDFCITGQQVQWMRLRTLNMAEQCAVVLVLLHP